ncbi:TBC1 domain family member 20 isoform X2 [Notothenia coriiceps]|uniref:TBC1 domain family member 20 isoform X2 n=1 Tax=Notothenia coriiceps TaxID=8208 RepID=A0A6I9MWG7_9TELE|nr:PREDICTED: TBC1 domain family member 20 isoform X2 [Notothenia coriiceps]
MNKSRRDGASSPANGRQGNDWDTRRKRKIADITQALSVSPVDVAALRRMAISEGGLLTDEIRCQVWPRLLNVPPHVLEQEPEKVDREDNKDYNQVLLDVQRSLRRFPPGMPDEQREGLQEELIDIILVVLKRNPQLHYYQGYHDIVVTFLLVLGERLATALVEKLSTHHLRDFMDPTMDNTKHILNYLMPIIERVNPEVHDFMQQAEVGTVFALSWLITWFGHVLSDFRHVVRLYDFFLACHPLMPIYFAAVIPQDLPYETLISRAGDLFVQFPPSEMAREAASHDSMAASTFKDFDLASTQQRPDSVLRRRRKQKQAALERSAANAVVTVAQPSAARRFVRLAVMGLTVALGAAALAVVNSALQWAPKLDLFP